MYIRIWDKLHPDHSILTQLFCSVSSIRLSKIAEGVSQNGAWVTKDSTFMCTSPCGISFYMLFLFYSQLSYACIRIRCFPFIRFRVSSQSMCVCLKLPASISVSKYMSMSFNPSEFRSTSNQTAAHQSSYGINSQILTLLRYKKTSGN